MGFHLKPCFWFRVIGWQERRMRNVIHIFGASGSGTTTLGKRIADELGFKLMDTDDYF